MPNRLTKDISLVILICFVSLIIPLLPSEHSFLSLADEQNTERGKKGHNFSLGDCSVTLLKNREYFPVLSAAIDNARKEIMISFFLFKTDAYPHNYPTIIMEHLIEAAGRGVKAVVILEKGTDDSSGVNAHNQDTMVKLKKGGVEVYFDSIQTTTHTKLVVIDRRYTFVGSHNLTHSALKYNNELSVLIDSAPVAEDAASYINSLYP
ncbi:MAG: phospholipase D-like domain-containing protein [Syntrophales bacterium]